MHIKGVVTAGYDLDYLFFQSHFAIAFDIDIDGPQRMISDDFVDALAFHLVPTSGQN